MHSSTSWQQSASSWLFRILPPKEYCCIDAAKRKDSSDDSHIDVVLHCKTESESKQIYQPRCLQCNLEVIHSMELVSFLSSLEPRLSNAQSK